jgi:hypothetical protein
MIDSNLPHDRLRVRVHGCLLVAQPYAGTHRAGKPLIVDLDKGAATTSPAKLTTSYLVVRVETLSSVGLFVCARPRAATDMAGSHCSTLAPIHVRLLNLPKE